MLYPAGALFEQVADHATATRLTDLCYAEGIYKAVGVAMIDAEMAVQLLGDEADICMAISASNRAAFQLLSVDVGTSSLRCLLVGRLPALSGFSRFLACIALSPELAPCRTFRRRGSLRDASPLAAFCGVGGGAAL